MNEYSTFSPPAQPSGIITRNVSPMHRIARAEADAKTCLVLAPLHAQPLLLHPVPARARASHCQTSRSEYDAIAGTLPRQPQNHTPPALERPQPPHALEGRHSSRCPPRMSSNGVKGAAVSVSPHLNWQ